MPTSAFWDARAALGPEAGTRDRIAKQLEIEAIARYVKNGMTVLDVGCGDGETAIELARRFSIEVQACDSSETMIAAAVAKDANRHLPTGSWVYFWQWDILDPFAETNYNQYDLIYTQRCLINLPNWLAQRRAIGNIAKALKPGGLYVMLENSWEGLQAINDLRERVSLPRIEPPSHNWYLRDEEIVEAPLGLVSIDDYSSTYYYLSRVVNAALAAHEGKEPEYDSPINKLALSLPPLAGLRGQGRIWIWRNPIIHIVPLKSR